MGGGCQHGSINFIGIFSSWRYACVRHALFLDKPTILIVLVRTIHYVNQKQTNKPSTNRTRTRIQYTHMTSIHRNGVETTKVQGGLMDAFAQETAMIWSDNQGETWY